MVPILEIGLLGGFKLSQDGRAVGAVSTPRLQSLLAYLLLHRQAPVSRQSLACLFWPDTSDAQARTNLRNLVHNLRQSFPACDEYIRVDAGTLAWRIDAPYRLDVAEFERCLAVTPGSLRPEALDSAVQIYGGDLLPGCYDDWIQPERERLRAAYLSALAALVGMAEDTRHYPVALEYARRLVAADPLDPAANLRLMHLHALLEDRPAALKTYREYARRLELELGEEPERELREVYDRLRLDGAVPSSAPPSSALPLVGRELEWRELLAAWRAASAGSARMIFISGDAGIGKTRLVEELSGWAMRQGVPAASAYCYPAEGSLPFAPAASWLRARPLPPLEKPWLVELARLLPELYKTVPGLPDPVALHEAGQRQHLFEALARAVLRNRRAQLLILEDIHWCDRDTLEWLHFLLRFDPGAPLLIAATVRSGEVEPGHPLADLQTALRAENRSVELALRPLSQGETAQLAAQAASQAHVSPPEPQDAARIYRESEGNPLFIVEMVRLGRAATVQTPGLEEPLAGSPRVQAVLAHRLRQLNPATLELTSLAATIGREFSLGVLRQASSESEENVVGALDELLQRRIVLEISPETYDFSHDRLRQAAFSGLSSAHRRLLHRRVAEAYLRLDEGSPAPRSAAIASHYENAGLLQLAVHHYRLAAEASARLFATAQAIELLRHAIRLVETCGLGGPGAVPAGNFAAILERLGDQLALDGQYPQALACFERALAQPWPAPGVWRSQVYRKIADALVPQYHHPQAHAALDQAEDALNLKAEGSTLDERQEWLQIQLDRTQLCYWAGQTDRMDAINASIRDQVESEGRLDQRASLLSHMCQARLRHERFRLSAETVAMMRRRLELSEQLGEPYELAVAQFQYGFNLLWHGELAAARDRLAQALETTTRVGARIWQVRSLAYLSIACRKLGELNGVRSALPPLLEHSQAIGEPTYHGIGLANRGWLAWKEGDPARAEADCRQALQDWSSFGGNVFHGLADWVLLAVAAARRDLGECETQARALLDPDPKYQPILAPLVELLERALAACQAGDKEAAFARFDQALAAAHTANEL